jgi:hypothetical protein
MRSDSDADHKFWREVIKAYRFPLVMFALAIIPFINVIFYSGHGGIGWLVLPICFPWVVVKAITKIMRGAESSRTWYWKFYKTTIPAYILAAIPLSWIATTALRLSMGFEVSTWMFFAILASPFPWWYFS